MLQSDTIESDMYYLHVLCVMHRSSLQKCNKWHTSARRILRSLLASSVAWGVPMLGRMGRVMTGVLMLCAAVMNNSRSRGIPRVTLASPLPAMIEGGGGVRPDCCLQSGKLLMRLVVEDCN